MTKDGERRGVHKMYVNVVLHVNDEGRIDPLAVIWPDGRTFRIDEVLYRGEPGQMQKGGENVAFPHPFRAEGNQSVPGAPPRFASARHPRRRPLVGQRHRQHPNQAQWLEGMHSIFTVSTCVRLRPIMRVRLRFPRGWWRKRLLRLLLQRQRPRRPPSRRRHRRSGQGAWGR